MLNPFVNADQVNAVIKVRRGLEVDRLQTIYEDGEVIYSVDKRRVFVGDGYGNAGTYGGNVVGNLNFCSDNYQKNLIEKYDLVYRTDSNGFYLLTGDDVDLPQSYVLVGGPLLIPPPPPPYVLSAATRTRRGGVEIREGLKVDNGRVSIDLDESTLILNPTNQITINPNVTANAVNNLPHASYIKYGGVMIDRDKGLRIDDGVMKVAIDEKTITLDPNVDEYRLKVNMDGLPKASKTTTGILKVGYGLVVDGDTVAVDLDSASMAFYGNKIGTSSGTGGGGGSSYTPTDATYIDKGILKVAQNSGLKIIDGTLSLSIDNDSIKIKPSPTGTSVLYADGAGTGTGGGATVGLIKNALKGNGGTTYVLNHYTDNDYDNYLVFVNGVQQIPGDAFTIVTPNIQFSSNIPTNADIIVYCSTNSDIYIRNPNLRSTGQYLKYDGTNWIANTLPDYIPKPANPSSLNVLAYDQSSSTWMASTLSNINNGTFIPKPGSASTNQVLSFDGTNWVAVNPPSNFIPKPANPANDQVLKFSSATNSWIAGAGGGDGIPIGTVSYFASNSVPAGWLECNGSSVSTSVYPDLFSAIGTRYGGSGGNFNLPDLRGEFLRGWDNGRGVDTGRTIGSWQKGTIIGYDQGNDAVWAPTSVSDTILGPNTQPIMGVDDYNPSDYNGARMRGIAADSSHSLKGELNSSGGYSGTTRPRNVAMLPCIKAFSATLTQNAIDVGNLASSKVNWSDFSNSLTTNGWQRIANGLILQWGKSIGNTAGKTDITLPISFPNDIFCVTATAYRDSTLGTPTFMAHVINATKSNFTVEVKTTNNNYVPSDAHWIALGR